MEQIELSKQLSDDVFKAIVKSIESCEHVILLSLNISATTCGEAPCTKTSWGGVKLNGREGGKIKVTHIYSHFGR